MRISKAQKFEKEQYMIQQEIIGLLGLEDGNGFFLYELDRDQEKINQIMEMVPEIWKYFAHMNVTGLLYPEKCKRPWLSIVRGVLKNEWKLRYKPCRFNSETDGSVFTMRYYLEKRDEGESISESMSEPPSRAGTPDMMAMDERSVRGGTMSTNPSCESLCSLDDRDDRGELMNREIHSGRRKLKVKRRKTKAKDYQIGDDVQVDSILGVPDLIRHHSRRASRAGLAC